MRERRHLPSVAVELARRQGGVASVAQLIDCGISPRTLDRLRRDWHRLARGVYLLGPAVGDPPWEARVWAGLLLGGQHARAARHTAAILDGLAAPGDRVGSSRRPAAESVEILVGRARIGPHPGYLFIQERPGVRLPSTAREPARTRVEDTVLDLCADAGEEAAVGWITRACQRRLTSPKRLRERAFARISMRGRGLVLQILDDVAAGATSNLERRAVSEVLRPHGLPAVRLQHRTGSGGRIADAAFVEFGVLVEFDGRVGHVEEGAFRDRQRDNDHILEGWITLRFGWWDVVADPCAVAAQIARLLRARGWAGTLTSCPRCANRWVGEG